MGARTTSAASFARPPIVELACSVQFQHLPIDTARIGQFWDRLRKDFPETRDMPVLPQVIEHAAGTVPSIAMRFGMLPELRRVIFVNASEGRLLQLQADRFVFNWQKVSGEHAYPRYAAVQAEFLARWSDFLAFLVEIQLPLPAISQCELTYINHVPHGGLWTEADFSKLLPWFSTATTLPDDAEVALHWADPDIDGRLHFVSRTGHLGAPLGPARTCIIEVTARGRPVDANISEWMDRAHAAIVDRFLELTGPEAHLHWGKLP